MLQVWEEAVKTEQEPGDVSKRLQMITRIVLLHQDTHN